MTFKGQFEKGHIPHNKGVHAPTSSKCAETYFTKEHFGKKHCCWTGGMQKMKNDCIYKSTGANKRVRNPRLVWEQMRGKIPAGMCIWHIDGEKHNDDIDNLEIVTRAEMLKRNRKNRG
ncbi:MAG: HNH endonuclease [Deltaproteobacteria bacterium]|nr:HNH endonuclease [Deltaproteobacteria bacterium]